MFFSIVIPIYNVEQYLSRCINSCLNQEETSYEIILINDGSTDNSWDIANSYLNNPRVSLFSQPNKGLSAARNVGIMYAKGEYIVFLDSDDYLSQGCLSSIRDYLEKSKVDVLSIGAINEFADGSVRREEGEYPSIIEPGPDALERLMAPCAPFKIWKTSFIKDHKLLFFEGIFHEDCEFTPRAVYLAKTVGYYEEVVYHVNYTPNSITRSVNPKKAFDYINYVCPNLSQFSLHVKENSKNWFDRNISIYINNALANAYYMGKSDVQELETCLYSHKYLFVHLLNSGVFKYRIEYYLFKIFPHKTVFTYRILNLIRSRVFFLK